LQGVGTGSTDSIGHGSANLICDALPSTLCRYAADTLDDCPKAQPLLAALLTDLVTSGHATLHQVCGALPPCLLIPACVCL
jgi:hypothetical protein